MRVILRRDYGSEVGAGLGAAAVTAAGEPELIPLAAPLGAKAGTYAESKLREMIKTDPPGGCENLTTLKYWWDAEMDGLINDVMAKRYEGAESRVSKLIRLDTRILDAVQCMELKRS